MDGLPIAWRSTYATANAWFMGERSADVLAAAVYMVVFRIAHVLAAIAWGGSVFLFVVFVQPSVAAIAPAGAPFMVELLGKRKLVSVLIALGTATVIGGAFLYWHDAQLYGGFGDWIGTAFGVTITIGAVAAILALAIGILGTRPNVKLLLQLGRRAAEMGGPTPELAAEIARTQARLKTFARVSFALIIVAAVTMAIGRYL
jgi:hypothetical protein